MVDFRKPNIDDIPPEMLGNMVPQKCKGTQKEVTETLPILEKLADWARKNSGTQGEPELMKGGGPGDSHCISVFLASLLYKAGHKVRLVAAIGGDRASGVFVEVFHPTFLGPKGGQWIAVLPFGQWIFETADILKSRRIVEVDV